MFLLMMIFVMFLSLLSFLSNNYIVWWSIFLMMTIIFIFLNKGMKSFSSMMNYFIIQESLGLMFLLMNFSVIQFFILMMKVGVAPLHFWIFNVLNNVYSLNLMWFLTFQKLPFLVILLQFFLLSSFILMFVGLLVCYLQMFLTKGYKNLLILSSTESFNWILMGLFISFFNVVYMFIYYFVLMLFLISKFSKMSFNSLGWETILVFLNLPFSVTFFVKIFSLSEIFKFNYIFVLLILFLMFLSILSFSYWLINISVKLKEDNQVSNGNIFFLVYPLMMLSII